MTHGRTVATAVIAFIAVATPAVATQGSLYEQGPNRNFFQGGQVTVTEPQPNVWQISYPASTPALAGKKWGMSWGCPTGGTQVESVTWGALRYSSVPSAFGAYVTGNGGQLLGAIADVNWHYSPNPGSDFRIHFPPGHCEAELSLQQSQQVNQHARVYWVANPRVAFRDVAAPTVALRDLTNGWVNAQATSFRVGWAANDNMGADGMLEHTVSVQGIRRWIGSPGVGEHAVEIPLTGIPDGQNAVEVTVAGDGTAPGSATSPVRIDRTAPVASKPFIHPTGDARTTNLAWSTSDVTSGVASSVIEINSANDGSLTGSWVTVTTPIAGPGDLTQNAVSLNGVQDGAHALRVRVTDNAGNLGYSELAEIIVDRTPPTVTLAPLPATPVRRTTVAVTLSDNLAARLGLGATSVEVNSAPDGSASGLWYLAAGPLTLPAGPHQIPIDLSMFADGPHLIRVTTANGGANGERIAGSASGIVIIDATSPSLSEGVITRTTDGQISARWIARDARSGVATSRIEWQDGGIWRPIAEAPATDGADQMIAGVRNVPNGNHRFRLVIADRAGNEAVLDGPLAGIDVDNTLPTVTGLQLTGPPWAVSWKTTVFAAGPCDTTIAVNGPGTGASWRTVASVPTNVGPQSAPIPTGNLAAGIYRVRVTVCDAATNTAIADVGGLAITARGSGVTAGDPALANARVTSLAVQGRHRTAPGRRLIAPLTYGSRIRVTGRVLDAAKTPLGRVPLLVTDSRGTPVGRAMTAANGRFSVRVRPIHSGALRFAIVSPSGTTPISANARLVIRMTPLVSLRTSTRTVIAGGDAVVFRGQIAPTATQLGLSEEKRIVLEWRDPVRRVWRPILNDTAAADGTFQVEYQFQAKGQSFPVRVRVPKELGWSFEEGLSPAVGIRVR
jgi:hypothetical protein